MRFKLPLFYQVFASFLFLGSVCIIIPSQSYGQSDSCPFAVPSQYECSSDHPPCHRTGTYFYCSGVGNISCCTIAVNEIMCCGDFVPTAYNVGQCGTDCGVSGRVVEPTTGRVSNVCLGPAPEVAETKEPPKPSSSGQHRTTRARNEKR
jgi:hypothetical protein